MSDSAAARPRIRILPDHVANQIAAGEVVESPASVVKELAENSLDAGARVARVSIAQGGKGRIRVADDGCGMIRQDLLASVDRHATSKIRRAEDLRELHTLGFRGEALPSIAAVSRMVIETAAEGEPTGSRLRVMAGRIQGVEDFARRRGTTVEVRNLFLNTPVRARFLRAAGVETRAVSQVLHALALANLRVRFVFESNGRGVFDLAADRRLEARIGAIWPDAQAASLVPLASRRGGLALTGAVQRPDLARPGFRRTHLFVGGRPIRDPRILAAADRGYRTTIPQDARPWLFLFLSLPPQLVDVNVHPGKAEVRFRDLGQIEKFVEESVREALEGIGASATWVDPPPLQVVREAPSGGPGGKEEPEDDPQIHLLHPEREAPAPDGASEDVYLPRAPRPALLQIHNSFILAETRDGLIILDQHAAHERILYERIVESFEGAGEEGQRLLFPFTIRLTEAERELLATVARPLAKLGFDLSPFGLDAVLVQAVPSPHRHFDAETCIREMIRELLHGSDLMRAARNQHERVAMSFACKAAIKAGRKLAPEEMHELFDRLFATRLPYHDIHGRPTVVRLGLSELQRKFGRR